MKANDLTTHFMLYSDGTTGKPRPIYIADIQNKEALVYKITSQFEHKSKTVKSKYFEIKDWKITGLKKQSWIDTYSDPIWLPLTTLKTSFGHLSNQDILAFHKFIQLNSLDY